jgi:hypothetical protein
MHSNVICAHQPGAAHCRSNCDVTSLAGPEIINLLCCFIIKPGYTDSDITQQLEIADVLAHNSVIHFA